MTMWRSEYRCAFSGIPCSNVMMVVSSDNDHKAFIVELHDHDRDGDKRHEMSIMLPAIAMQAIAEYMIDALKQSGEYDPLLTKDIPTRGEHPEQN